ncbi:MAG: integrase, partial [Ardenticatenales bacterium]|nr:integrase [Ardenticatenales bacterium]
MDEIARHDPTLPTRPLGEAARKYAKGSKAESTLKGYRTDWQHFLTWCAAQGHLALPADPTTVADYVATLAEQGECKVSTLEHRLASISQAHQLAGYDSPCKTHLVHVVMKGIRRDLGVAQTKKAPATIEVLRLMLEGLGTNLVGQRDRALLLVGFAGAFRRSELVGLDVADVAFMPQGMVITLRKSKTDQEGQGQKKAIPYGARPETCPVRALKAWLKAAGIGEGPLLRGVDRWGNVQARRLSDKAVALVVKRCAE